MLSKVDLRHTCVLCSHRFKIIDCLSLSSIPFQGLPLLGKLHSLDITRRIGSLIWSSLTLNVIHSGQLEAWTFFVRDLTDQDFQSNHTKTAREGSAWKAQLQQYAVEHSENSNVSTGHCLCLEICRNGLKNKQTKKKQNRKKFLRVDLLEFLHCGINNHIILILKRLLLIIPTTMEALQFSYSFPLRLEPCGFLSVALSRINYITHSKTVGFFIFQPSLSGSEWLMILRWIVERSSGGSARPWGGPGPPIAGFVMVCPWCRRYPSYPEIPVFSSVIAPWSIRIFKMKLQEPTQHYHIDQDCILTWNILEWCFFTFPSFYRVELRYWMVNWPFTKCSRQTRECTSVSQRTNTGPSIRTPSSRF